MDSRTSSSISASLFANRRYTVPTPTPALAAISSMLASAPGLAEHLAGGVQHPVAVADRVAANGRGRRAPVGSLVTGSPPTGPPLLAALACHRLPGGALRRHRVPGHGQRTDRRLLGGGPAGPALRRDQRAASAATTKTTAMTAKPIV